MSCQKRIELQEAWVVRRQRGKSSFLQDHQDYKGPQHGIKTTRCLAYNDRWYISLHCGTVKRARCGVASQILIAVACISGQSFTDRY